MEGGGHAAGISCAMPRVPASTMANDANAHTATLTGERMASVVAESKWSHPMERHFPVEDTTPRPPQSSVCPSAHRDASCSNHSRKGGSTPVDPEAPPATGAREAGIGADDAAVDGPAGQPAPAAGTKRDRETREELESCVSLSDAHAKAAKLEPRGEVEGFEDYKSSSPDTVRSLEEERTYSTADLEAIIEEQSRELASLQADRESFAAQSGTASDHGGQTTLPRAPDALPVQSLAERPHPEPGPGGAPPPDASETLGPAAAESTWSPPDGEGQAERRAGEVGEPMAVADEEVPSARASEQSSMDEAASLFSCGLEALSAVAAQASQKGETGLPCPPPLVAPKPPKPSEAKPKVESVTSPRCHTCGATETPKWRCAMTLCNACGLRASESRKSKTIRPTQLVAAPGMMGMQLQMAMPQMAGGAHPYYTMMPGAMMHPCMGAMPQCAMQMVPMPGQDGSYPTAMSAHAMGLAPRPGYACFDPNQAHVTSRMMAPYGVVGANAGSMQPCGMLNHSLANAADQFAQAAAAAGSYPCYPFASHGAPFCAPSAADAPSCDRAAMDSTQQLHRAA